MGVQASQIEGALGTPSSGDSNVKRALSRSAFADAIQSFIREQQLTATTNVNPGPAEVSWASPRLRFVVRKRPINEQELASGEFDVVTKDVVAGSLWLHKCAFRLDDKHMFIDNQLYNFADTFYDESDNSERIFAQSVRPLLEATHCQEIPCSIIMFGATGSGKTFTMNSLLAQVCQHVFLNTNTTCGTISGQCVEVSGTTVRDLLLETDGSPPPNIDLMDNENGTTVLVGASCIAVESAEELLALFHKAFAARITRATGVHDASSRTHLIYRIYLDDKESKQTSITLTDLAGSEWARDQRHHNDPGTY